MSVKTAEMTFRAEQNFALIPDLLQPGLRLVFCGTALSRISAREQAYYANPGNLFWRTLHETGLTPERLAPKDYARLLDYNIGLTDLCKTTSGQDDELPKERIDVLAFWQKMEIHRPGLIAFTSKNAAQWALGHKVEYGLQSELHQGHRVYVCCSTSGLARRFFKIEVWQQLCFIKA